MSADPLREMARADVVISKFNRRNWVGLLAVGTDPVTFGQTGFMARFDSCSHNKAVHLTCDLVHPESFDTIARAIVEAACLL